MEQFLQIAMERAKRFDGFRSSPYRDSEGFITVGYGLNLEKEFVSEKVKSWVGVSMFNSVKKGASINKFWEGLTMEQDIASIVLMEEIKECWKWLKAAIPWTEDLHRDAKIVLVDMAYNMGVESLLTFKKTLHFLELGWWETAAEEMLRSRWAEQVGSRATENSEMIKALTWDDRSLYQRIRNLEEE